MKTVFVNTVPGLRETWPIEPISKHLPKWINIARQDYVQNKHTKKNHVFRCHGIDPTQAVLGVWGGGGAARSTVHAWVKAGGTVNMLGGRRELSDGPWDGHLVTTPPSVIVDFDGDAPDIPDCQYLQAAYAPLGGTVDEKAEHLTGRKLDGRWLLVAQHLACWRTLWCCERVHDLPSLSLLLTKLIQAETTLEQYA